MAQVRGIIFDIDGTLVDSNDAHHPTTPSSVDSNL